MPTLRAVLQRATAATARLHTTVNNKHRSNNVRNSMFNNNKLVSITIKRQSKQNVARRQSYHTYSTAAPCSTPSLHTTVSMPNLHKALYTLPADTSTRSCDERKVAPFRAYTVMQRHVSAAISTLHQHQQRQRQQSDEWQRDESNDTDYSGTAYSQSHKKKLLMGMLTVTASTVAATVDTEVHADTAAQLGDDDSYELIEIGNDAVHSKITDSADLLLCKDLNELKTCRTPTPSAAEPQNSTNTICPAKCVRAPSYTEFDKTVHSSVGSPVSTKRSSPYASIRSSSIDQRSLADIVDQQDTDTTWCVTLTKRELYNTGRYFELGQVISENAQLRHIKLDNCLVSERDVVALRNGLDHRQLTHINKFDITGTNIGESCTVANDIITLLLQFDNLESVNLSHNSLTEKHVDAICTLITNHPKMHSLNLSWNGINSGGAKVIASMVRAMYNQRKQCTLHTLDMSKNFIDAVGKESLTSLQQRLRVTEQKQLNIDLADNPRRNSATMPLGSPQSGGLLNIVTRSNLTRALSANSAHRYVNTGATPLTPHHSAPPATTPPSPFVLTASRIQSIPMLSKPSRCIVAPHT